MKRILISLALLTFTVSSFAADHSVVLPAKISASEIGGAIFKREDMAQQTHEDGHVTQDVTSLLSSDKKFASGMYTSGKTRSEISEPYGVDEFMYFISRRRYPDIKRWQRTKYRSWRSRHHSQRVTGIWDTEGYSKIWVIYSADGSGLE